MFHAWYLLQQLNKCLELMVGNNIILQCSYNVNYILLPVYLPHVSAHFELIQNKKDTTDNNFQQKRFHFIIYSSFLVKLLT
jgi:hypothetical protein